MAQLWGVPLGDRGVCTAASHCLGRRGVQRAEPRPTCPRHGLRVDAQSLGPRAARHSRDAQGAKEAPGPLPAPVLCAGGLGAHASLHTRTCSVPVGIFSFSPCPKDLKTESVGARSRSETWGAFFQGRVFVTARFLGSVLPEPRKLNLRARIFNTARAKASPCELRLRCVCERAPGLGHSAGRGRPQARDCSPCGFETKAGRRERLGKGRGARSPGSGAQWPEPSVTAIFITSNT